MLRQKAEELGIPIFGLTDSESLTFSGSKRVSEANRADPSSDRSSTPEGSNHSAKDQELWEQKLWEQKLGYYKDQIHKPLSIDDLKALIKTRSEFTEELKEYEEDRQSLKKKLTENENIINSKGNLSKQIRHLEGKIKKHFNDNINSIEEEGANKFIKKRNRSTWRRKALRWFNEKSPL